MTPEEEQKIREIADLHWDYLITFITYIKPEDRDDALLGYLHCTAFLHGAKHFEELKK